MLRFNELRPASTFLLLSAEAQAPLHLHDGKLYLYEDIVVGRSIKWIQTPSDIHELLREQNPIVVLVSLERLGPLRHVYTQSACRSILNAVRTRVESSIAGIP